MLDRLRSQFVTPGFERNSGHLSLISSSLEIYKKMRISAKIRGNPHRKLRIMHFTSNFDIMKLTIRERR